MAVLWATAMAGCGTTETCIEKPLGGDFCLGDSLVSADQILKVELFDVDVCAFSCATRGGRTCQVVRDGGFIQLQVVGQVCQPAVRECPEICKVPRLICTLAGLPIGRYEVGSPGQPSVPFEVVLDGGSVTACAP